MIHSAIVTGGTGVTGNALVRYLLQKNIAVTALIRPGSFRKKNLPEDHPKLKIIECGLQDYAMAESKLKNATYDVFFHLAWDGSTGKEKVDNRNNFKLQNQNVLYSLDAVGLCNKLGCKKFVMTGSQAEYGRKEKPVSEDMEKHPENGYGMAKLCAEEMTRKQCELYGIHHIWAILFSIYGPYDETESLIDTSVYKLMNDIQPNYTLGEQRWDYLYSYDAAKALLLLAEKGRAGETYHVGNGRTQILRDYITTMYRVIAPDKTPVFGEIPYVKNQVMLLAADISKLQKETGFKPEYTFEQGIDEIRKCYNKTRENG